MQGYFLLFSDWLSVFFWQFDLVNTIGEAAALGAAGVISWGDMKVTESEVGGLHDSEVFWELKLTATN